MEDRVDADVLVVGSVVVVAVGGSLGCLICDELFDFLSFGLRFRDMLW